MTPTTHEWSARCLPPFLVGDHNDWEEIVEIMKEERINIQTAKTMRDRIKIFVKYLGN